MLLLTRKAGDSIVIGPDIVVKVLEVQGNRVQLGIDAPKDVKIVAGKDGAPDTHAAKPAPEKK